MKIKLIDFGVPEHQRPYRPHGNDAGADVYLTYDCTLQPGEVAKIPLGFGLEIPDGYAGYISKVQRIRSDSRRKAVLMFRCCGSKSAMLFITSAV